MSHENNIVTSVSAASTIDASCDVKMFCIDSEAFMETEKMTGYDGSIYIYASVERSRNHGLQLRNNSFSQSAQFEVFLDGWKLSTFYIGPNTSVNVENILNGTIYGFDKKDKHYDEKDHNVINYPGLATSKGTMCLRVKYSESVSSKNGTWSSTKHLPWDYRIWLLPSIAKPLPDDGDDEDL